VRKTSSSRRSRSRPSRGSPSAGGQSGESTGPPLAQRDRALEQGAADHGSFEPERREVVEVRIRPDASGREHREPRPSANALQQGKVGAGQRAVALDRRAEEARHAHLGACRREVLRRHGRFALPACGRDLARARVHRHDERLSEPGDELVQGPPAGERRRADDDAGGAGLQERLRVGR
jgi:hypothetical protein